MLFCLFSHWRTWPKPWALGAKEFTLLAEPFRECELFPEEQSVGAHRCSLAWDFVNVLSQSLLNDPKCTNDNWYCLFSCFPHSGKFNFQVFILKEFLNYLNECISVRWACHIYNLAFLIDAISDYIWFIRRYFPISMNWHIPQNQWNFSTISNKSPGTSEIS